MRKANTMSLNYQFKIPRQYRLSACLFVLSAVIQAQDDHSKQVFDNMGKIVVNLKVDREAYFPGEIGQLTISVQNATTQDLEILKPFVNESGGVMLLEKGNTLARAYGLEYGPVSPPPDGIPIPVSPEELLPTPTVIIRRGEQAVKTLNFFDKLLGHLPESELLLTGSAPPRAGDFQLAYWGEFTNFQVVRPVFEGLVKVNLQEFADVETSDGPTQRARLRVYAFVLAFGGKHFLCVERLPYTRDADEPDVDEQGRVADRGLPFGRYSRFVESDEPFRSLHGEADAAGDLALTWEQSGGERHLNLARTDWQIAGLKFGQ
jgi:hypothetical protein